ncbi:iron chelate uptake ABC transporter family permease subunit [Microbacterium sp. cx-59]|uniref:FecCD family ABC transporter permease n=1 Tax=Microbacterium sp. cx-59 TaxID=2891207 RepID=UPI001E32A9C4|nr:iron ABC transporter permease [Microbacterium sp. cx-59]MCC4907709.1 iron ABC transporter permease [Microbacterium sp. cx-59]
MHRRTVIAAAAVSAGVIVLATASVFVGRYGVDLREMAAVLTGQGSATQHTVIVTLRIPRVLLAILVGASLGIAGAIVQTTARNALASPDLLGVTGGASAAAVAVIVLGGGGDGVSGFLRTIGIPAASVVGGLAAAILVLAILRRTGTHGPTPILVGIGVSTIFTGLVSWLLIAADVDDLQRASVWLTGTLNGRSWPEVTATTLTLVVAAVALLPFRRGLDVLTLGEGMTRSLGYRLGVLFGGTTILAVLLTSVATAAAGPIAFLALVSPHLARMSAARPRAGLVLSGLFGAGVLLGSDLIARAAFAVQLPTGAITALVGAPFLLFLLISRRQENR